MIITTIKQECLQLRYNVSLYIKVLKYLSSIQLWAIDIHFREIPKLRIKTEAKYDKPSVSKVMEKTIHNQTQDYLQKN